MVHIKKKKKTLWKKETLIYNTLPSHGDLPSTHFFWSFLSWIGKTGGWSEAWRHSSLPLLRGSAYPPLSLHTLLSFTCLYESPQSPATLQETFTLHLTSTSAWVCSNQPPTLPSPGRSLRHPHPHNIPVGLQEMLLQQGLWFHIMALWEV